MKPILIAIIFTIATAYTLFAQDYVYKRNVYGEVEVFNSRNGTAQGQPIGKFKKDLYGNVQFFSFNGNTRYPSQQVEQPKLIPVQPQFTPATSILGCLNAYYNILKKQREQQAQQDYTSTGVEAIKSNFERMNSQLEQLKNFYTQVINKPAKVNDGWHNVTVVSPNVVNDFMKSNINADAKYLVETGYALVAANKIQSLILTDYTGGAKFERPDIISGTIESCKAFYKDNGSTGPFDNEVYFLDYILDSTTRAVPPQLGTQKFVLGNNVTKAVVGMYRKDPLIYGDAGDNWIGLLLLIKTKQGETVKMLNHFTSLPGKYFYTIDEINHHKWAGTFILAPNSDNTFTVDY